MAVVFPKGFEGVIMRLKHEQFIILLKETLNNCGIDFEKHIIDLGQVSASEKRDGGHIFDFREHLRGFVLSLLSKQRTWGPIAQNLKEIEEIFFNFEYLEICKRKSEYFTNRLTRIKCGNRSIHDQMTELTHNIDTLLLIQSEYGTLDSFVSSSTPDSVAKMISDTRSRFKLKQLGYTLALEYLKNVGIKAIKPDVHMRRIISNERLALCSNLPTEVETVALYDEMAKTTGMNPTYLDNLLWIFCAKDYGAICGAVPKCDNCELRSECNY